MPVSTPVLLNAPAYLRTNLDTGITDLVCQEQVRAVLDDTLHAGRDVKPARSGSFMIDHSTGFVQYVPRLADGVVPPYAGMYTYRVSRDGRRWRVEGTMRGVDMRRAVGCSPGRAYTVAQRQIVVVHHGRCVAAWQPEV